MDDFDDEKSTIEQYLLHVPLRKAFRQQRSRSDSARPEKEEKHVFFCDWYPKLFGIDEDEIPTSEDEEGLFIIDWDDVERQAYRLTPAQLEKMRVGSRECLTDEELKEVWLREQFPRYGRRARQKQILERENHEKFECTCNVDYHYNRYYVPSFGGGVAKEGEELRIPHFKAFLEDFKEKTEMGGLELLADIFAEEKEQTPQKELGIFYRPKVMFPGSLGSSIREFREKLLSGFRPLSCREVRRYRMPYSEALYLELQEDDYLNSAAFFKYLLVKDYFKHKENDDKSPSLRERKNILNKLVMLLKLAERFAKREEYHKEAHVYLRTGKYFSDSEKSWWWIADEFYAKATKVSSNCVIDGGKAEAISHYIYGTFLLDYLHRMQLAQEHLWKAREISLGKDWSARTILKKPQGTIHKECVTYLCRALIAATKELRYNEKPEEALPLIHRCYKLCDELGSWRPDIEMEMYFELGMAYQGVGMLNWAKKAFRKFLERAKMQDYAEGICDGYLEVAICYRREDDLEKCHLNLCKFLRYAKLKENKNLTAFGNRYLGEFALNNGYPEEAKKYFSEAFFSFYEQLLECQDIPFEEWKKEHFTLINDIELARVLYGLAAGELLTKPICTLIGQAKDGSDKEQLLELINWKNRNVPQPADLPKRPPKQVEVAKENAKDPHKSKTVAKFHSSHEVFDSNRIVRFKHAF